MAMSLRPTYEISWLRPRPAGRALRRLLPAPEDAAGWTEPRPASAIPPLGRSHECRGVVAIVATTPLINAGRPHRAWFRQGGAQVEHENTHEEGEEEPQDGHLHVRVRVGVRVRVRLALGLGWGLGLGLG